MANNFIICPRCGWHNTLILEVANRACYLTRCTNCRFIFRIVFDSVRCLGCKENQSVSQEWCNVPLVTFNEIKI